MSALPWLEPNDRIAIHPTGIGVGIAFHVDELILTGRVGEVLHHAGWVQGFDVIVEEMGLTSDAPTAHHLFGAKLDREIGKAGEFMIAVVHATAVFARRFDDLDRPTQEVQLIGCAEARHPGADDHDVAVRVYRHARCGGQDEPGKDQRCE